MGHLLQIGLFGLTLLLMIIAALAGPFLPFVPGPAIIWVLALAYSFLGGFASLGILPLLILTVLMILGSTSGLWLQALGVKATGGSIWSILGSLVLGFLGLLFFPPWGALIGSVIGAFAVEWLRTGDPQASMRTGGGTLAGYLVATGAELVISLCMIATFVAGVLL